MTKWDTIQADVADQYAHIAEEEMFENMMAKDYSTPQCCYPVWHCFHQRYAHRD